MNMEEMLLGKARASSPRSLCLGCEVAPLADTSTHLPAGRHLPTGTSTHKHIGRRRFVRRDCTYNVIMSRQLLQIWKKTSKWAQEQLFIHIRWSARDVCKMLGKLWMNGTFRYPTNHKVVKQHWSRPCSKHPLLLRYLLEVWGSRSSVSF